jgi:hypothetical protein
VYQSIGLFATQPIKQQQPVWIGERFEDGIHLVGPVHHVPHT